MIVVDSSVWVNYFNGVSTPQSDLLRNLFGVEHIGIGDLILTEVLQGFREERDYRTARRLLGSVPVESMLGGEAAIRAADDFRTLRRSGVTVRKTIDVMIASHCIARGHVLLHADRDFDLIAGVLPLAMVATPPGSGA